MMVEHDLELARREKFALGYKGTAISTPHLGKL
jgi:hypothetical protein